MGFKCGIIGLPNVGKSTLFNALTETNKAEAANYPFATIEPNIGRVAIPDKRLEILSKISLSEKKIPILVTIVFLLVTSYVAAFHHNFWVIDHDGQVYLHAGQEILAGNGNNVELHNAPIGGPVIYAVLNLFFNDGFSLLQHAVAHFAFSRDSIAFACYFCYNNHF